jgi:hypothetical protein
MNLSFRLTACAVGIFLFAATLAGQQQGQQPARGGQQVAPAQGGGARQGGGRGFTNLQVLPREITQPQLIQIMQGFNAALGVNCDHCHVFLGQGNPGTNMASDDKQPKKTARLMLTAARDFNAKLTPADLGKAPNADVTPVMCGTCHRGKAIPDYVQPPPPPAAPPARGGGAGAGRGGGN